MIDAHIHLDQYDPQALPMFIEEWQQAGVKGVIAVSTDLASSYHTLELQERFPTFVKVALGFHPEQPLPTNQEFQEWEALLQQERHRIVAIGEIGLPHYNLEQLPHSLEHSKEFLRNCLEIANGHDLPVALHAVHDKAAITLQLLKQHGIKKAHFHWLKAPDSVVREITATGYYISVTPEVCYRERDQHLARIVPIEQLLIETDGPWPYSEQFRGQLTTPLFLKAIVHALFVTKDIEEQEVSAITQKNTITCYRL